MSKSQIRYLIFAFLIIGGGYGVKQLLAALAKAPESKPAFRKVVLVRTEQVQNSSERSSVAVTGKLAARNRIEVFAEVSGILRSGQTEFREGNRFSAGSVLVSLDDREARENLLGQKSAFLALLAQQLPDLKIDFPESFPKWQAYINNLDLAKPLADLPKVDSEKEKLFLASRTIYQQYYQIKSAEVRLSKYTITAPFSGMISQSNINPGTLVRQGQKLGDFLGTDNYELECAVSLSNLAYLKIGDTADLRSQDLPQVWQGKIIRISDRIDPNTQTATIYLSVSGPQLREGMFLSGSVQGESLENTYRIERNLLVGGNQVYIVKDTTLLLHPIKVVKKGEKTMVVSGIPDGTKLLAERIPEAYEGMVVKQVNDNAKP